MFKPPLSLHTACSNNLNQLQFAQIAPKNRQIVYKNLHKSTEWPLARSATEKGGPL